MPKKSGSTDPKPRRRGIVTVRVGDFAMYNTKDITTTRAFDQKIFALKRGHERNAFWSEFATEPLALCLNGTSRSKDPKWNWHGPACIAFAVDDVPAAISACEKAPGDIFQTLDAYLTLSRQQAVRLSSSKARPETERAEARLKKAADVAASYHRFAQTSAILDQLARAQEQLGKTDEARENRELAGEAAKIPDFCPPLERAAEILRHGLSFVPGFL